jgi:hypothetical protein
VRWSFFRLPAKTVLKRETPLGSSFIIVALLLSCGTFSLGSYLVWPSRWNVVGHIQLGLFFVQFLVPLLWTDFVGSVRSSTLNLYTWLMIFGALMYLFALPIGLVSPRSRIVGPILALPDSAYGRLFRRRVLGVTFCATIGLLLSFIIMGFVPMFADDPLQAKYFQGEYRAGYLRAVAIFRPSFFALISYLPLLVVVVTRERKCLYIFLLLAGVIAIVGCLNRSEIGMPLLAGTGIIVAAKRSRPAFVTYLAMVVLVITLGTLANYFLKVYFALNTGNFDSGEQISELVAVGAPDVSEGLRFFDNFEEHEHYTYGAQFVGGLIPFQFLTLKWIPLERWNPGLWAQGVLLGTDDQDIVRNSGGGGLRIAVPISGYAAFGWFGAALMSMVAGFLTGYLVRFARMYAGRGSIEKSAVVIAMYLSLYSLASNPCAITHQQIPQIMMLAWLIYPVRLKFAEPQIPIDRSVITKST